MGNHKVAIVTGGSQGLGFEIVQNFLNAGYKVLTCARRENAKLNSIPNLDFIKGDICVPDTHNNLINKAMSIYGNLNVYVNNAGVSSWRPIEKIEPDFLNKLFATNIYSAFWGCKAASKYLKTNDSIINISSIAGKRGSKNNSAYVATKFAMNGLTQSLSKELGEKGIRVNAVCPVLVKTDGLISALKEKDAPGYPNPDNFIEKFKSSQSALGRLPTSKEVAEFVLFLASNNASAITGQCINIDCGVFPQ